MNASLNEKLRNVKWGEYELGELFDIDNTLSFNTDMLVSGYEYDYVTRTSFNQGILQATGFVNSENINPAGTWSLGLLQMDFFYRRKPWYAGQFVRKITPKIEIPAKSVLYITALLNKQKPILQSVLVRNVDNTFKNLKVLLPVTSNKSIDFDFMESFIEELETERIAQLSAYLKASGLVDYELSREEEKIMKAFINKEYSFGRFRFNEIFNNICQGRRLKKEDQLPGNIPFVMSGTTNTGVVGYISNPVASFPKNAVTIDIFGNAFYRNYSFGAGDDTGVYWNDTIAYSEKLMLYFAASMGKSLQNKFSYGKKLRSSKSGAFEMQLLVKNGKPDYHAMEILISAIQKLVIKDVVRYADRKIELTKEATSSPCRRI